MALEPTTIETIRRLAYIIGESSAAARAVMVYDAAESRGLNPVIHMGDGTIIVTRDEAPEEAISRDGYEPSPTPPEKDR